MGDSDSASHWEYVDFDLEIGEESEPRKYRVSVRSPEGEAQEEMRFPFDEWELRDKLRDVEVALLRSGGTRRRIGTPEEQTIQGFGRALFEALLVGEVGTQYRVSWREARRQNKGLRVKLHVRPPELSSLPWEFVYDPQHSYLGLGGFDPETEEGAIALSDEVGRQHLLGASDLALLLDDHYFLRLVFLNSCEGARGSPRDAF